MKKHLYVLLVVIAVMSMFASIVFAAPASKSVSLLSAQYNEGGVVLIFQTSGLTRADLKSASLYADSNWQKMFCTFIDDTTKVRCTLAKKLAGRGDFRVVLAGVTILGKLPSARATISCPAGEIPFYSFNQYYNGQLVASGVVPVWIWNDPLTQAWIDQMKKQGYTFEITGTFCGSETTPF